MEEITNQVVNQEGVRKKTNKKTRNIKLRTPTRIWIQAVIATIFFIWNPPFL